MTCGNVTVAPRAKRTLQDCRWQVLTARTNGCATLARYLVLFDHNSRKRGNGGWGVACVVVVDVGEDFFAAVGGGVAVVDPVGEGRAAVEDGCVPGFGLLFDAFAIGASDNSGRGRWGVVGVVGCGMASRDCAAPSFKPASGRFSGEAGAGDCLGTIPSVYTLG